MVVGDLRPLWETDLAGHLVGAVDNPVLGDDRVRVVRDYGLPDADLYFNSGMMLLDLDGLRGTGCADDIVRFVRDQAVEMPWADQEPLNAVLWDRRLRLHPKWNVMNACYDLPARKLPWSEAEIREAIADPRIVHFHGPYKAWHHRLRHPFKQLWASHLGDTPYHDRPVEGRTTRHTLLRAVGPRAAARVETLEATGRRSWARGRKVALDRFPQIRRSRRYVRAPGSSPRAAALGPSGLRWKVLDLTTDAPGFVQSARTTSWSAIPSAKSQSAAGGMGSSSSQCPTSTGACA